MARSQSRLRRQQQRQAPRFDRAAVRAVVVAGSGAVIVSLVECALELALAGAAVPDGETGRAGTLFHLINRMDGAKMLALAAMALASVVLAPAAVHFLIGWATSPRRWDRR